MTTSIKVRHNIEVAHRLFESPGKCENIHGHSMWVELEIFGVLDSNGMLSGLDFGEVKKRFRGYLDSSYDHHLILNTKDPWSKEVSYDGESFQQLPGVVELLAGDPTTENIAKDIAEWASNTFVGPELLDPYQIKVTVWETAVNAATWETT